MTRVFIGLGTNVGDRRPALQRAVEALGKSGLGLSGRSSIYRTDPVEVIDQEEFMNQVVECRTDLAPAEVLRLCLDIERSMGRVRDRDKGPRTIDLDLLLHGELVVKAEGLEVPHPRLHLRRFVLVPLAEIAPDAVHPVTRLTVLQMLERCPDNSRVELLRA